MTDITTIDANLLGKLKSGIAESRSSTVIAGGKPLLRLLKDAIWVFGQKDDQVQKGSVWAVNPLSITHGWVAWTNYEGNTKNERVGEVMEPIHMAKPVRPAPVDNWPFAEQRAFDLRCMEGSDEGTEVHYKVSSVGGIRAVDELLGELQAQLDSNPAYPCPVVELQSTSYPHKKWGKVYVPIFKIVDWSSMGGQMLSEDQPELPGVNDDEAPEEPVRVAAPTPRPRAAAPAAAPSEPEPTARRRPIRRG